MVREGGVGPADEHRKNYEQLFGASGLHYRSVGLETENPREPTKRHIELLQFISPQGQPFPEDFKQPDVGYSWVGIPIKDLDARYDSQPHWIYHRFCAPPMTLAGLPPTARVSFVSEPDGNLVELTTNDHLSFCVADAEKALTFYRDLLGLKVGTDGVTNLGSQRGKEYEAMFGLPRVAVRFVRLFAEGQVQWRNGGIEFGQWFSPSGKARQERNLWDVGTKWPVLVIKDANVAYRELSAQGVRFISPPVQLRPPAPARVCVCYDPEGNPLFLRQPE